MKAGEASITARRVAAQRLTFDRLPAPFGDPGADDRLARDVAGPIGDAAGPLTRYLSGRTAFFDRAVVDALGAGVDQVVVLGAGYDGRSMRYAKSGVRWFEVDHPATQADKLERLERLGISSSTVFTTADFTLDDVAVVLDRAGHDAGRPTLFLCEGVAVYLDPPVLERLLAAARARSSDGSRLGISLSVPGATPEQRRDFQQSVARVGEPARNVLTPDDAAGLFGSTGWRPVGSPDSARQVRDAGFVLLEPAPNGQGVS
jgi:methyltransferase (TIGR00027 family)